MKRIVVIALLLVTLTGYSQDKAQRIDSVFVQLNKDQKFFGNVLIAEKGKVIYQKSFGKAFIGGKDELNDETLFELASVTKQFTAMGIMLLKKQGKLSYEDSLGKFIPELPYYNITVRQLLNHTSGLPDYIEIFDKYWESSKIATNQDMIALLAKYAPAVRFAPGEKWEYSNTGYALLASILEKVSGMDYGAYLGKHIFQPLEMKRSMVYRRRYEKKKVGNYAYGHVMDKKSKLFVLPDSLVETATMVYSLDGIMGDGTVNSTTNDLLKWDGALYTEKLVSKEMMEEAFSPAKLNNGKTHNYGFGWGIGKMDHIGKVVSHSGGWPGYATYIERHIETGSTIIVLSNFETLVSLKKIRNILYDIKENEEIKKEMTVDSTKLKGYIGEYELAPGFSISITTEKDKIYAQATGQERFEIFAESEDLYFLKVVEAKLKFSRDEKGMVNKLTLYQSGQEIEGMKIK